MASQLSLRFQDAETNPTKVVPAAKKLFREYSDSLDFSLDFQDFDRELDTLPGEYASPSGILMVCFTIKEAIGCAALRKIEEEICEMKRLYVKPKYRGEGIGRILALKIIEAGKLKGYHRMRLDTVSSMKEAISLYQSLGFKVIGPYRANPIPGAVFMELRLA